MKPSKMMRSKNSILSLAYNAQINEQELSDYHAASRRSRMETSRKYGF